ncbi:MAG: sulfite exporter TauE/SafE family protein [Marinibacterium sp.]|nr:sulfite exporter TauE/SafE family protein [Marinibacterium sp.]
MFDITWSFLAVAIPAVFFAGVSKGGFGSGAAFVSGVLLAVIIDPKAAIGLMLPLLMLIDLANLRPYWRRWSWPDARLLILGGVPGIALGVALFRVADDDLLRLLIGGISLLFVAWQLVRAAGLVQPSARRLPPWAGLFAGVLTGFTSFVSHAGGPPAAIYLLSQRLDKTTYQASTVLVFWAINIAKFVPYAVLGLFTWETGLANLILAPVAVAGAWAGVRLHHVVPERLFFGLTYVLLTATGAKLIWDALA